MESRDSIAEIIVVEGRDDTDAINRAVRALTIETHGFGISKETWDKLDNAYEKAGLIIFTDPDHAGNEIRKKLKERYPLAKEAFLTKRKAIKGKGINQDIGIENANPEDIREALKMARATWVEDGEEKDAITLNDLEKYGLIGYPDSKEKRELVGEKLGIGYANGKTMVKRLNGMKIEKNDFIKAAEEVGNESLLKGNN